MSVNAKATIGAFALTWAALGAVLIGALTTPAQWCDEIPQPTGQTVMDVGFAALALGGIATTAAVMFSRKIVVWLTYAATASAVIGVLVVVSHLSSNAWGADCG